MRATLLKSTIKSLFPTQRTSAIEGSPGGGKTTICEEVARELNVGFIEKHMPTMLVEDFGIMYPNGSDMLHYKLPDWFPSEDRTDIPDTGILCFDDRNQANADFVRLCMNLKPTLMIGVLGQSTMVLSLKLSHSLGSDLTCCMTSMHNVTKTLHHVHGLRVYLMHLVLYLLKQSMKHSKVLLVRVQQQSL